MDFEPIFYVGKENVLLIIYFDGIANTSIKLVNLQLFLTPFAKFDALIQAIFNF